MRHVTRDVVYKNLWNSELAEEVKKLFDEKAGDWSTTRNIPTRGVPVLDALERGEVHGKRVVDLGAGTGLATQLLVNNFESVVAVDISKEMLKNSVTPETSQVCADGYCLPFASNSVDVFLVMNMILFPNEIERCLKDEGVLASIVFDETTSGGSISLSDVVLSGDEGVALDSTGPEGVDVPSCTNADADDICDDVDDCIGAFDDCGVCNGGNADDLGCGCGEAGPSGCDNTCGSTLVDDECGVCGGSGIADGDCDCDGNVDLGCGCGEAGPSGCDINAKKPPMFIMEPPTIRIFKLNLKNKNVVSHLSFVGNYDGPYPFYSDEGLLLD